MNVAIDQLKADLSGLPESDRADLACYLLESLEQEELDLEENQFADEWRDEIERRIADLKSGRVVAEPIENLISRLRESYP